MLPTKTADTSANQRGAIIAEFAVILPLLIILVFGVIEMSIAFNRHQAVHAAAREGARVASIPGVSAADACNRTNDALTGINFDNNPNCAVSGDCSGNSESVDVTVSADHTINLIFVSAINVTLSGEATFRCE
ncbi:MAG: TadE/TadG family type IV pilus assembly protein [Acidimicrobiales bacterium]